MKTEKQSIVPKSFIVMMMVMLGIALLPIRYYGYYPDFPRSHPISTFPKRITDKMGANADRFAGYCLRKTGKFV